MNMLRIGSMALIVTGTAILARGIPLTDGGAVVTGRVLQPAELEQVTGARTSGPCVRVGNCSRLPCDVVNLPCSYCSGSGQDMMCVCMDDSPCQNTTTPGGCGTWQFSGRCGANKQCNGGWNSGQGCPRTGC